MAPETGNKEVRAVSEYGKKRDAELVRMTLDGDADAYGELVCRYQNTVYAIAYRITGRHEIAEDIAQDAFVDGFVGLSRLSDPEKFAPWMFGFAKRKALHQMSRTKFHEDIDEIADFIPSDAASPEECSIQKERTMAVRSALSHLSEKNRRVATLFYFDGRSVAEIASALNLPTGTVKSRLYETRVKLKGELADMYMEENTHQLSPISRKRYGRRFKSLPFITVRMDWMRVIRSCTTRPNAISAFNLIPKPNLPPLPICIWKNTTATKTTR